MNRIIVGALSFLLSLSCLAQSTLPPCPSVGFLMQCYGVRELSYVKYVGEFFSGMPDGQGSETFSDGSNYVGEFRNGQRNGRGTYTFPKGDKYVGEFKGGSQHGQGILYDANGKIIATGYFENDKLVRSANAMSDQLVKVPSNSSQATFLDLTRVRELEEREAKVREQERLRTAELQAERKRREELEEKLRIAQQPPVVSSVVGKRVALVIGNAAYKQSPLDTPVNDAKDVAAALRVSGFETRELLNATKTQMLEATRAFERMVLNSDVALIYFAGHGTEVKGKNYMIPVGANIAREYELPEQAYDAAQWLDMLEGAKGTNAKRVNIVILDACRNNELTRSWRSSSNGLAKMDAPVGTFLAYSTAPGKVALDGDRGARNSPFAKHMLTAIKQPNMPIEQVFKRVRSAVIDETKGDQIPWDSSSLVGDFFFTVKK